VKHIISLGAGVQSSTMALMAAHGEIEPMPDAAVFADTQAEPEAVYRYLEMLEQRLPYPVIRVTAGSLWDHEWGASMRRGDRPIMVPYRSDGGLIRRQCTNHFKVTPIDRELTRLRDGGPVTLWIGISTDEASRMKPARQKYKTHRWPLIEAGLTRGHCLEWLERNGYPRPPRSACVFCPYKGPAEWRDMDPEEFERACVFDEHMRDRGGKGKLWVWRQPVPLREVDFRSAEDVGQGTLFGEECEGMCGV
jgi:hypothetical protein